MTLRVLVVRQPLSTSAGSLNTLLAGSTSNTAKQQFELFIRPPSIPGNTQPCRSRRTSNTLRCIASTERAEATSHTYAETDSQPSSESSANGANGASLAEDEEVDQAVITTFKWPAALDGQEVSVVGSFSDWQSPIELRKSPETGDYIRCVPLAPGNYQYKYVVDGVWTTSPCEPVTSDGQGFFNNQRLVSPTVTFHWSRKWGGSEVFVAGDFTAWAELVPLRVDPASQDFNLSCSLTPGTYSYQFLVDGTWMTSPEVNMAPDDDGHLCNKVTVEAPIAFHIFYATGWDDAVLQVRNRTGDEDASSSGWREVPMFNTPSRASPQGGSWKMAVVPATGDLATGQPQLDFFVSNGSEKPFPRARAAPTMLVSDLDGTMVGDGEFADAATTEFSSYWEDNAALCGSVLVYNTGRSLGQFMALFQEKAGALALPDVLITAVGTKIFLLDTKNQSRGQASAEHWKEDLQWSRRLDQGWDLNQVKRIAGDVVQRYENDNAAHWLDKGIEHPHRIALSVRCDKLADIAGSLQASFSQAGLQVRIIVSGTGDWRYVDCVSIKGGKLEALEYVRTLFSVPRERCVAAGDSGNDILMLEGANPAVVVGNAQPELLKWLVQQQQTGRIVYTDAHMARGIMEGISRLGLY
ncbi:hypothetical protein WJX72_012101 [[Myrmecia] bisecta]|uniref:Sucrose-phosphate phosphatase n=1 Tax=[Myrmecia] bisecta TaxID=41462 RepID=A0AAW1QT39_9CHLO